MCNKVDRRYGTAIEALLSDWAVVVNTSSPRKGSWEKDISDIAAARANKKLSNSSEYWTLRAHQNLGESS